MAVQTRNFSPTRLLEPLLYVLASTTLGRSIVQRNVAGVSWQLYEQGRGKLPMQGRYLMASLLRLVVGPFWSHAAHLLNKSTSGPEELALQLVNVLCIVFTGWIVTQMRNDLLPGPAFPWLTRWILLWVLIWTYAVRYEQALFLPYDLPSLAMFSAGVLFCMRGALMPFLITVAIGSYNREAALFLVPIWLTCNYRRIGREKLIAGTVLAIAAWSLVRLYIMHTLKAQSSGFELMFGPNLRTLLPHHLPQVLTVGGYLAIPLVLLRRSVRDPMLRRVWVGYVPFVLAALTVGLWNETRIFGELSVAIACTAEVAFEATALEARKMSTTP